MRAAGGHSGLYALAFCYSREITQEKEQILQLWPRAGVRRLQEPAGSFL